MLLWTIIGCLAVLSALWMARPYLRNGRMELNDSEGAISVFRDQRDEVDHDLEQGLITEAERDAAILEIEQRVLKAAHDVGGGMSVSRRSLPATIGLVVICGAASVGMYAALGAPDQKDQPLAARQTELLEMRAAAGDTNSRIQLLIERTREEPESFDAWWSLAMSYSDTGDYASAVDAYRKAAELGSDTPGVQSAYAEALVLANGNKVPAAARVIFEQVLQSRNDPRAMYYVALAKAQAQDFDGALNDWAQLLHASSPGAPWIPLVRGDIVNMARFLERDVTLYLPDASASEIAGAGGAGGSALAATRIAELETGLETDPLNYEAWVELATLRSQEGDTEGALDAIMAARDHYAGAPFVLQQLDETARALGLDLLIPPPSASGPSAEQVAAARDMSEEDRDDMVDGMVSGLAAKLEENPNNLEGWIMLIRSYSVLGQNEMAQDTYRVAQRQFSGNAAVLARLQAEAGALLAD